MDEFAYVLEEAIKAPQATMISIPAMSSRNATPGPLASVTMSRMQAIQETRVPVGPSPTIRDLANRALEEMIERAKLEDAEEIKAVKANSASSVKTATTTGNAGPAHVAHSRFHKSSEWERASRQLIPTALTVVALGAAVIFAMNEAKNINLAPQRHQAESIESLLKQGRYEEALPILQTLKQKGQLKKKNAEDLNKVRISVAIMYAQQNRFGEAIALLKQIPPRSKQADRAKLLLHNYKAGIATN